MTSGLEIEKAYSKEKINKKGKYKQEKKGSKLQEAKGTSDKVNKHNLFSAKIYSVSWAAVTGKAWLSVAYNERPGLHTT